jgi:hypothetical protein
MHQNFMQVFENSCIFSKILKTWRENLSVVKGIILVFLLWDTGVDCGFVDEIWVAQFRMKWQSFANMFIF